MITDFMRQQQLHQQISHSYKVRVRGGDRVRLTAEQMYGGSIIQPGTEGTVISESNAGFNGIIAAFRLDSGVTVYNVSTGRLEKI